MDLEIMSGWDAEMYVPRNKTYAVRIFSPRTQEERDCSREEDTLMPSLDYIKINEYEFSDMDPHIYESIQEMQPGRNDLLFNEEIAQKMLLDFIEFKDKCETFLVHCSRGRNRSPAVGIAFNEIFKFGYDSNKLVKRFPETRWYVHDVLRETAKKMGL